MATPEGGALAALALTLLMAAPAAAAEETVVINAVVASVDGSPITLLDLDNFSAGRGRLLSPDERASRESMLDAMVMSYMFQAEFQRHGIVGDDRDVEVYIANILEQTGSTREELLTALDQIGLTWDDYFERMREEVQRLALINREVRSRVNVTPEEIERHWKESGSFELPDRVEISDIFIPLSADAGAWGDAAARRTADEAYEMATSDGFAAAARQYSKGPTAAEGGALGVFAKGSLAPEFEDQLAKLDEGGISKPFTFGQAIHLVKLERRLSGGRESLDEVREEIREQLYNEYLDERFKRWVAEDLRERHHVTVQLDDLAVLSKTGP